MEKSKDLLKSNFKNRRKAEIKSKFIKVESPLAKYDSAGNLSCILCRIPIKSSVWKVHLNSKQHKQFVELAKRQPTKAETTSVISHATKSEQIPEKAPVALESTALKDAVKLPIVDSEHTAQSQLNTASILPDKFFDQEKSVNSTGTDRDQDAEWNKFQKEIREAATLSNIIVAEEQDSLNIKRHLKEIDEQIENWKRFIKINDKKNVLAKKQRKEKRTIDLDLESSSSEECSVDDLLDWRIKSVHK